MDPSVAYPSRAVPAKRGHPTGVRRWFGAIREFLLALEGAGANAVLDQLERLEREVAELKAKAASAPDEAAHEFVALHPQELESLFAEDLSG
jgi:hypothetical protein